MDVESDDLETPRPVVGPRQYACFISYSTARDYKLARLMHRFLSGFPAESAISRFQVKTRKFCMDGVTFRLRRQPLSPGPADDPDLLPEAIRQVIRPHLLASDSLLLLCAGREWLTPGMKWEVREFLAQNQALSLERPLWLAVTQGRDPSAAPTQFFGDELASANLTSNIYFDFRGFRPEAAHWDKVRNFEEEQLRLAAEMFDVRDDFGRALSADDLSPAWQRERLARLRRTRSLAVGIALAMSILTGFAIWQAIRAETEKKTADNARHAAEDATEKATKAGAAEKAARQLADEKGEAERVQRELGESQLQKASKGAHGLSEQELDDNRWQSALAHTRQALDLWAGNLTAAHWAESLLTNNCSLRTIGAWDIPVTSMVFSPDGKTLYTETNNSICAFSTERYEQLWSVPTPGSLSEFDRRYMALSHDGKSIAFIREEGAIEVLDAASGQKIKVVQKKALALASSPTAPLLAAVVSVNEEKAKICFLDLVTFTEREVTISSRSDRVRGLRVSPNGRTLAIFGDYMLEAIDIRTGKQISKTIFAGALWDAQFSPDSSRIALSGRELAGAVVSVADGKRLWMEDLGEKDGKMHNFRSVAYSPDGLWVATCGGTEHAEENSPDNLIRLFSPEKGKVHFGIRTSRPSEALDISEDGVMMACEDGNTVMVLDLDLGRLIGSAKFPNTPSAVTFAPGNRCLAVACWHHGLYLLEPAIALNSFQSQPIPFSLNKPLPGERILQMGGVKNSAQTGDVRNHAITAVTLNASAHTVAFAGDDNRICVCSFPAGHSLWSKNFAGVVDYLAFANGGESLVCVREGESSGDHKVDVPSMENIVIEGKRDCFLELFDTQTGSMKWMKTLPKVGRPMILSDDTVGVAGAGAWGIKDGKQSAVADPIFSKINLAISCEDHVLITVSDKLLQAWSLPNFDRLFEVQREVPPTLARYVLEDHRLYLAEAHTVKCFTPPSFSQNWESTFSADVKFLAVDANGACLAGTGDELRLLDVRSGEAIWQKSLSGINDLKVFPDQGTVLTGQKGGQSCLLDLRSGRRMFLREHPEPVLALSDELINNNYAIGRFGVNCEGVENSRFLLSPPPWFRDALLLSQGWFEVRDGVVEPVSVSAVGKALQQVKEEFNLSQTDDPSQRNKEYDRILAWMFGVRLARTVSPSSSVRLVDAVEASLQGSSQENVHYSYYAAPWHPLAGFGLAATEENAARASFLRKWGLLRLQASESDGMDKESLGRYCGLAARMSLRSGDIELAARILAFGNSKSLVHPILNEAEGELERATNNSQ